MTREVSQRRPGRAGDRRLTAKHQRFVAEYCVDLNATQAYIRAGYSEKGAAQSAEQLLRNPEIAKAVAELTRQHLAKVGLLAETVLEELRRLAFSDVARLFDVNGKLKPLRLLSPEDSACIASLEVIIKNAEAGDGHTDTVHKIKVWDKTRSLEMLAKHFRLLDPEPAERRDVEKLVILIQPKP